MSNKAKIAKYRTIIDTLAKENESLRLKLLYAKTYEGTRQFIVDLIKELEEKRQLIEEKDNCILGLKEDIEKLTTEGFTFVCEKMRNDYDKENYLESLPFCDIFALAKKSIRLTAENSEINYMFQEIEAILQSEKEDKILLENIKKVVDKYNKVYYYIER